MQTPFQKELMEQKTIRGFTLIELLVVIAIIAILAGLLMPAVSSAQKSAKKTTAKNQVVQIATAITAYETEYGRLPNFSDTNLSITNLSMLLSADLSNNPRGLNFIEVTPWKPGKGGTNASGFCNPFTNTGTYQVALDTNYANTISVPFQSAPGRNDIKFTNLTKHIGVWTVWTNGNYKYIINSWD